MEIHYSTYEKKDGWIPLTKEYPKPDTKVRICRKILSGRFPIYNTTCLKDKSLKFEESYYTPKDCPFLDKEKRKDKINNLLNED